MGAEAFHGRVRDGIGCISLAMATGPPSRNNCATRMCVPEVVISCVCVSADGCCVRCVLHTAVIGDEIVWAIRTAQLRRLPDFHLRPIDVVVFHGPWGDLV